MTKPAAHTLIAHCLSCRPQTFCSVCLKCEAPWAACWAAGGGGPAVAVASPTAHAAVTFRFRVGGARRLGVLPDVLVTVRRQRRSLSFRARRRLAAVGELSRTLLRRRP